MSHVDRAEQTTRYQSPVRLGDQAEGEFRFEQVEDISRNEAVNGSIGHWENRSATRLSHLCTILPRLQPLGRQADHGHADIQTDVSSICREDRLKESVGERTRTAPEFQD